jgi:hypothetical protein
MQHGTAIEHPPDIIEVKTPGVQIFEPFRFVPFE